MRHSKAVQASCFAHVASSWRLPTFVSEFMSLQDTYGKLHVLRHRMVFIIGDVLPQSYHLLTLHFWCKFIWMTNVNIVFLLVKSNFEHLWCKICPFLFGAQENEHTECTVPQLMEKRWGICVLELLDWLNKDLHASYDWPRHDWLKYMHLWLAKLDSNFDYRKQMDKLHKFWFDTDCNKLLSL